MTEKKDIKKVKRKLVGFVGGEKGSISKTKALAVGASLAGLGASLLFESPEVSSNYNTGGDWHDEIGEWTVYNKGDTHESARTAHSYGKSHTETIVTSDPTYEAEGHQEETFNWDNKMGGDANPEGYAEGRIDIGNEGDGGSSGGGSDGGGSTGGGSGSGGWPGGGHSDGGYSDWDNYSDTWNNESPKVEEVE